MKSYLAVDIGASNGRHILGKLNDGRLELKEIHRFENNFIEKNGHFCWEIETLFQNVLTGLRNCKITGFEPVSLGIDSWGVDYVLLNADNEILGEAYSYRDNRTHGMDVLLEKTFSFEALYGRTGIAKQPFNTIYQLMAHFSEFPEHKEQAGSFLMIPDYLAFRLTGRKANEYTEASTTAMLNAVERQWDRTVLKAAGIPLGLFEQELNMPGNILGDLSPEIRRKVGFNISVLQVTTHDTASAFVSVPSVDENAVILSSGTWSLLGVENENPLCDKNSRKAGFTNEGGYQGRYRYLQNIMGLWILQCIHREHGKRYSFADMADMAAGALSYDGRVNVNDNRFLAPGNMMEEIKAALAEGGYPAPVDLPQLLACVYHSLVDCYQKAIKNLEVLCDRKFTSINIVGGGSKNELLNQMTADATGLPVYAGPTEGTALGNLLIQMIVAGEFKDLAEARKVVRESFKIKKYEPKI